MNRGDFILSVVNTAIDTHTDFGLRYKWSDKDKASDTRCYAYIIKERVIERQEAGQGKTYSVDVGVRLAGSVHTHSTDAKGSEWRNEAMEKLELAISNIGTQSHSGTDWTYSLGSAYVAEIGGYFDDGRNNADADAIINLIVVQG